MNKQSLALDTIELQKRLKEIESISLKIAVTRVLLLCIIVIALLCGYYMNKEFLYFISLVSLVIFIYLLKKHDVVLEEKEYLQSKQIVLQRYLDRFNDAWKNFEEIGIEYIEEQQGKIKDLDIVGKQSIYQYCNIANTRRGKRHLIKRLTNTLYSSLQLQEQQEVVKELSLKQDFVLELEIYGQMLPKKKHIEEVLEEFIINIQSSKKQRSIGIFKYLIPMITIGAIAFSIYGIAFKWAILVTAICVFGQLITAAILAYKNSVVFQQVVQLSSSIKRYAKICKVIEKQTFTSNYGQSLLTKMKVPSASHAIEELDNILDVIKQRNNIIAFLLFNAILLWDVNCVERFNQWIVKYGKSLDTWLQVIGEIESLSSLQVLLQTKPITCFPTIVDSSTPVLEVKTISHPLIASEKAIANDFTMSTLACVITGSNMSGKTTFLRTLGLNMALAYAGGPVLSNSWKSNILQIYTSMRIEDDVSGISTFYGELLRIKEIVEGTKKGIPMIAFIDEIFKGTNSNDRIIGAKETVKRLQLPHVFTFITTHDFELCELEKGISCSNYHFEEYYQDNKIHFDYTIKKGRSKTTNAQYLLKMVGIIED